MSVRRILFIVDSLRQGGLAKVIVTLVDALHQRGHPVGIAVLEPAIEERPSSSIWLASHNLARPAGRQASYRRDAAAFGVEAIARFEAEVGPADIIVAAGELALRCAPAWRHPHIVFSTHSSQLGAPKHTGRFGEWRHWIKRRRRGLRMQSLLNGRHVHAVSQGLADELLNQLSVRPASMSVIGNPFDVPSLRAMSGAMTPESASQTGSFVVGVGALSERKRFGHLMQAFARSGLDGDLVLVGEGEEEAQLKVLAKDLGLGDRFRILPFHPNHFALVARARALALTSRSEGLGNVLIEALILGVPAISTDCPHGPRDILGQLDPRALVPLDDIDLFATRLRDVVLRPYPIPESAVDQYRLESVVERYLALADLFHAPRAGRDPKSIERAE